MKNFSIMKNQVFRGGVHEKSIYKWETLFFYINDCTHTLT